MLKRIFSIIVLILSSFFIRDLNFHLELEVVDDDHEFTQDDSKA
jgi:hypothetical protein